jgi:aldehyde dehydrogenase (NAD+)
MDEYKLYINGKWQEAKSGKTYFSTSPSTGEQIARLPLADHADLDDAISAARAAFDQGEWPGMKPARRSDFLLKIAAKIQERAKEIAEIEARDSGAVIRKALADVSLGAHTFRFYAKLADRSPFEPVPSEGSLYISSNFVLREPVGVCGQIIPWNFPFLMAVWKIAPAIAMGNTVVLKPSSETPLSALKLAQIIDEAGIPPGVVNVVPCPGSVAEDLATDPRVDKIAFTGSTEIGKMLMAKGASTVKKVTLELGGKSPVIVLDDVEIEEAIDGILFGVFYHQGQICIAGTRLLLPENLHDQFVEKLIARARQIRVGDPLDQRSGMGPLVSGFQVKKVEEYVQSGLQEGARLVLGGKRPAGEEYARGNYFEPTIFTEVNNSMKIAQEEIFGPVLSVIRYRDEKEAVRIANDVVYGLAGAVWSSNVPRAIEIAKKIRAGTIWINDHHLLNYNAPFGGFKQSGIGREMGLYGINEYTEPKHIHVDLVRQRKRKVWYNVLFPEK